jgi:geranylgeranyl diphosphate synthase type I
MKATKKKRKGTEISPEEAMKQLQKIFKKRGSKALEMARKEILQEKIECKEAREALTYFMTEYWNDLARPTLLSLACEAVGGDPELTTPIAVPMILVSGAIDIHDDIIDESKTKYGRPTVYGKFGKDIALLVGDALLFKGFTLLHEASQRGVPAYLMPTIINIIKETFFELGDAEALELSFRGRIDVSPQEYLHMIQKKAADVEAHTKISAIIGNGSKEEIEALSKYGRLLGMIKLLRDDVVDLISPKELIHRIKKESLPNPLLYALLTPKIKQKIVSVLSKKTLTEEDARAIINFTYLAKGFEQTRELIQRLVNDALCTFRSIGSQKGLELLLKTLLLPVQKEEEQVESL